MHGLRIKALASLVLALATFSGTLLDRTTGQPLTDVHVHAAGPSAGDAITDGLIFMAVAIAGLQIMLALPAGYALAKLHFVGKRFAFGTVLACLRRHHRRPRSLHAQEPTARKLYGHGRVERCAAADLQGDAGRQSDHRPHDEGLQHDARLPLRWSRQS